MNRSESTHIAAFGWLCAATIALSAFLLFQVQPIISKTILPWFGGSPAVWTTCLLFFQVLLLAGYAYAHVLISRIRRWGSVFVHVSLLTVAVCLLPITPGDSWKPDAAASPAGRIVLLLLANLGLPFFLVASTAPLHMPDVLAIEHPPSLWMLLTTNAAILEDPAIRQKSHPLPEDWRQIPLWADKYSSLHPLLW